MSDPIDVRAVSHCGKTVECVSTGGSSKSFTETAQIMFAQAGHEFEQAMHNVGGFVAALNTAREKSAAVGNAL